jgi:hypothetical protein
VSRRGPRRQHPVAVIVAGTGLLLGLDAVAWMLWLAWHVMPWLIGLALVVFACRHWQLHHRLVALVRHRRAAYLAERSRLPHPIAADQVSRLEAAANRPIEAVIASYERVGRQYGQNGSRS